MPSLIEKIQKYRKNAGQIISIGLVVASIGTMGAISVHDIVKDLTTSERYSWNKGELLDEIEFDGSKYRVYRHAHRSGEYKIPCLYLERTGNVGGGWTSHYLNTNQALDNVFAFGPSGSNPKVFVEDGEIVLITPPSTSQQTFLNTHPYQYSY